MIEYYELPETTSVAPDALGLERARQIFRAAQLDKDCQIIECMVSQTSGSEIIIVDLQSHGVPSRPKIDIDFNERLALVVPTDSKKFVRAKALRKSFPALIHQNQTSPNTPRDLCLYFEPKEVVLRTWTAQRFIRRVRWWMTESSKGTLHVADQPPEALFFNSNLELVAPHDFDELTAAGRTFEALPSEEHSTGGFTYVLSLQDNPALNSVLPLQINVQPVVHGIIEDVPSTMRELVDLFASKGQDVLPLFRKPMKDRIPVAGAKLPAGGSYVVLIVHTPMKRAEGEAPSAVHQRGFMIAESYLELGRKIGAFIKLDSSYYRNEAIGGAAPEIHDLESIQIFQFNFLKKNSIEDFQYQSGVEAKDGKYVLIGAGALGSTLANLWGRAGWGSWTIVDKDHIKPHNLTRHLGCDSQIGKSKATATAAMMLAATGGITKVSTISADATIDGQTTLLTALSEADLVVDASTTLEYPRLASTHSAWKRHVSVFLTPSGNSSVLLAENADRTQSLRTIEAQYIRAIIDNDWGKHHLIGNLGTFWSGGSCRDISFRLSLAQVQTHAGNLAQMVMKYSQQDDAKIAIWDRDNETGETQAHFVPVFKESLHAIGEFGIYLDEGVEKGLHAMRAACLPCETGGILLGYHDLVAKTIVIVKACPAPADSAGTPTSFERGTEGVEEKLEDVKKRTANIVGYVGEWHSHPDGHSANPSGHDVVQLTGLAKAMHEDGLPAIQLIVGEGTIGITLAEVLQN
jgi:integrative and conjugative element protein (TIGR02256 family)